MSGNLEKGVIVPDITSTSAEISEVAHKLHSKSGEKAERLDKLLWRNMEDQGFFSDSRELHEASRKGRMCELWDRDRTGAQALCLEDVGGRADNSTVGTASSPRV